MNRHSPRNRNGSEKQQQQQQQQQQQRDSNRTSGWGSYYATKRKEGKDRYAELDSSVAVAINAGSQPTLAKRRRQLANNRWEATSTKIDSDADKLFRDLLATHVKHQEDKIAGSHAAVDRTNGKNSHHSNSNNNNNSNTGGGGGGVRKKLTANVMLMKARKSFWKRKLSSLSTTDFDSIWNEGRNKFMRHIYHGPVDGAPANAAANRGPGAKHLGHVPNPPPSSTDRTSGERDTAKPVGREAQPTTRSGPSTGEAAANQRAVADENQNLVIDLCDSSDSEADEDPTEGTSLVAPTEDAGGDDDGEDDKSGDAPKAQTKRVPTNRLESVDRPGGPTEKESVRSSIGETIRHPLASTSQKTNTEGTAVPETAAAVAVAVAATAPLRPKPQRSGNRWSKLFLGPDFRMEFVFSLDPLRESESSLLR